MRIKLLVALCLMAAMSPLSCQGTTTEIVAVGLAYQETGHQPVVVMVDYVRQQLIYKVNSRLIAYKDLLRFLGEMRPKWPQPAPKVLLLVHEKTSLAAVDAGRGLITKAGYEPPRVFYFDSNKRLMLELIYSRAVPFSSSGELSTKQ